MDGTALVFAGDIYQDLPAKTAHGLIRDGERYQVLAVIDRPLAGHDAGTLLDGIHRAIPILPDLHAGLSTFPQGVDFLVLGVATHGGKIPSTWHPMLQQAIRAGLSIVNGLHDFLSEDVTLAHLAQQYGVQLIDVRKPKPKVEQAFWTGRIDEIGCPKIAVMGTDCAVGKRTTARWLLAACRAQGYRVECIYTGQTGWMQGGRYGFILDSTLNDFVGGELEHAMVTCWEAERPDLLLIEGQAAMRNPSGPCGAEFVVSGRADGVILVHAPARTHYKGWEHLDRKIPPLPDEISLIQAYGCPVLGVALNTQGLNEAEARDWQQQYRKKLDIPVVLPQEDGVEELVKVLCHHRGGQ